MNELPNEILVEIFKQVFSKYLLSKYIININEYQEDCTYCKNGHAIKCYFKEHMDEHNKIKFEKQIKYKYIVTNKDFIKIQQIILTCTKWKNICYEHFEENFKLCEIIKADNLITILDRIMKHVILQPDKEQVVDIFGEKETVKLKVWRYDHARNIILLNRRIRNMYYESVVDLECKRIDWCTLCNQPIRIVMDRRQLKDVMKGKTNRQLKKHRHCVPKITRPESSNKPVLINTEYIEGKRTEWWCHNKCHTHCLDTFNHCNTGMKFEQYKMNKREYRRKRMTEWPKLTGETNWNNSMIKYV
jgi:hypothetical protein